MLQARDDWSMAGAALALGLVLAGCGRDGSDPAARDSAKVPATNSGEAWVLEFQEQEPGIDPYLVRMISSADYLRMDDGDDQGDFILFDRRRQAIFSVTHGNHNTLEIPHRNFTLEPHWHVTTTVTELPDKDLPSLEGKAAQHLTLNANGQTCQDVVAVPGVLEEVVEALRAYHVTLAGQQALTLEHTPREQLVACDLLTLVAEPARHLDFGLPLRIADAHGRVRQLTAYSRKAIDATLFSLPKGYAVTRITADGVTSADGGAHPPGD